MLLALTLSAQGQIDRVPKLDDNIDFLGKRTPANARNLAIGTVEPITVFDVPCEVSGPLQLFGTDLDGKTVDYRSLVKKGQILAQIDPTSYLFDLKNYTAKRRVAHAKVDVKKAELVRLRIIAGQTRKIAETKVDPDAETLKNTAEVARANVAVCEAELSRAEAVVAEAQTELDRAQANVDHCTIHSPCDGIIVDRRISVGQQIVSGLSAPSLFLIADSLKHMQIWVDANEWQAARIKPGQAATFTIDAYPGETFNGTVKRVRLNATLTKNEVHYTVEVDTDNSNERLLPYLSATVHFQFDKG